MSFSSWQAYDPSLAATSWQSSRVAKYDTCTPEAVVGRVRFRGTAMGYRIEPHGTYLSISPTFEYAASLICLGRHSSSLGLGVSSPPRVHGLDAQRKLERSTPLTLRFRLATID